jgi:hypothetical protein
MWQGNVRGYSYSVTDAIGRLKTEGLRPERLLVWNAAVPNTSVFILHPFSLSPCLAC